MKKLVKIYKKGVNKYRKWEDEDSKLYYVKGENKHMIILESYHGGYTETFMKREFISGETAIKFL